MSPRDQHKSKRPEHMRVDGKGKPSVVGTRLGESSGRRQGRDLPRGGIRERDGLKVADGVLSDSTILRQGKAETWKRVLRTVAIASGVLLAIVAIAMVAITIMSHTSMFKITQVEAVESEHVTIENAIKLADVPDDATLLNVDAEAISEGVQRNPWVSSVEVTREFPNKLRLIIRERSVAALVSMGAGGTAWYLGDDGVWIEPSPVEVALGESTEDAAVAAATEKGLYLITDVPGSVRPLAGAKATDECILAVLTFREQFSSSFRDQIVCFSAPSDDDISCVLENGIEVSLGYPSNVSLKEKVAQQIIDEYAGQVTYINVRVPSRPTYRRVNSEYVAQGSGANGVAIDTESKFSELNGKVPTGDGSSTDEEGAEGDSERSDESTEGESGEQADQQQSQTAEQDYTDGYSDEDYGLNEEYNESWDAGESYSQGYDDGSGTLDYGY